MTEELVILSRGTMTDRTKVPDKRKSLSFLLSFVALGRIHLVAKVATVGERVGVVQVILTPSIFGSGSVTVYGGDKSH